MLYKYSVVVYYRRRFIKMTAKQENQLTEDLEAVYKGDQNPEREKWYRKCFSCGTIVDFIIIIITFFVFTVAVESGYLPHSKQGFFCGDPSLSHRYHGDTISTFQLSLAALIVPLVLIVFVESIRRGGGADGQKIWSWYQGLIVCFPPYLMMSSTMKLAAGELRPHFFHTCAPDAASNCTTGEYIREYRCLNTGGFEERRVGDSFMSFPSGHAGISTITALFCAVYILKRLRTINVGIFLKPSLVALVVASGFVVSISRIVDHRHHWWDVLLGVALAIPFTICSILCHCKSFNVTEKDTCKRGTTCKSHICRNSRTVLTKGLSTKDLINASDNSTKSKSNVYSLVAY